MHSTLATASVLQVSGLCFHYPQQTLFSSLSATFPPGVTLVQGSGKTTLLRLLAGDLPAQGGTLQLSATRLDQQPAAYRAQVFRTDPRSEALDAITAVEYVKSLQPRYPLLNEPIWQDLVQAFSLTPHLHKPLYMLSTGSKRKVWLAAAFAAGATLTLLDEPFAALDQASIRVVMALLDEASAHPDRAWVVADYEAPGQVALAGTLDLDKLGAL